MKNTVIFSVALFALIACGNLSKDEWKAVLADLDEKTEAVFSDTTLTEAQQDEAYGMLLMEVYETHRHDSAGLAVFVPIITNCVSPEEALKMYEDSDPMIRNDIKASTKIQAIKNIGSVVPGKSFKEVCGIAAIGADSLKLSSFFGKGRLVLVDFWASWCGPCRREIQNHIKGLAADGRLNIVGVAVWEKDIDDTRRAMEELGVTWPVIYTGGRENSPTIDYGVIGIPTLFLFNEDGTVIASGNSIDDLTTPLI